MNLVGERVRQTSETDQNVPSPARAEPPVSESRQPPAPAASRPASEHTQGAGRELGGHWEDIGRTLGGHWETIPPRTHSATQRLWSSAVQSSVSIPWRPIYPPPVPPSPPMALPLRPDKQKYKVLGTCLFQKSPRALAVANFPFACCCYCAVPVA
jgi:hypothetical protein